MRKTPALTLIFLLLVSLYGLPLNNVEASEPTPRKSVEYDPGPIDYSYFWNLFNEYAQWDLEWFNDLNWISVKEDMKISRVYPSPNRVKLTLKFNATHEGDYRLTFAVDKIVRNYITKIDYLMKSHK